MYAKVLSLDVPLRENPFSNGRIIARINENHEIKVIDSKDGWCKVATTINEHVVVGYIASVLVRINDGAKSFLEISK